MKLNRLKEIVDEASVKAEGCDPDVEFWLGDDDQLDVCRIGQFSVVPDLVFTFKLFENDDKGCDTCKWEETMDSRCGGCSDGNAPNWEAK